MNRIDSKEIIRNIKENRVVRKNYTFGLSPNVVEPFKKICDENDLTQGEVLEGLIWSFLEGLKRK